MHYPVSDPKVKGKKAMLNCGSASWNGVPRAKQAVSI